MSHAQRRNAAAVEGGRAWDRSADTAWPAGKLVQWLGDTAHEAGGALGGAGNGLRRTESPDEKARNIQT